MLDKLLQIQERDKLSHLEMARRLGVGRSRWSAIRHGKQTLSDNLVLTAAGVWPELTRDLIERAASAASSLTTGERKGA